MKVNLKNACYPKPLLSNLSNDFNKNVFNLIIKNQDYDKKNQKLKILFETQIENETIANLIKEGKVYAILHLEQKTQRDASILNLNSETIKEIDLFQYSTTDPIEVIAVLFCKESFDYLNKSDLNEVYSLFNNTITYERGDILGYSNELEIKLPEDKRIGSIFNVIPDNDNILKGQPLSIMISSESQLIEIIVEKKLREDYSEICKQDQFAKKIFYYSLVEPAIVTAYTEMFNSYKTYKETKWCNTLASKIEKKFKKPAEELFDSSNYDVAKVYEYTNIALGDLFKDAVNTYKTVLEDE